MPIQALNGWLRALVKSFCFNQLSWISGLWIYRSGKIYRSICALGICAALSAIYHLTGICSAFLRNNIHALCHVLFDTRRITQYRYG